MLIEDESALRDWLIAILEPLCDAEPTALARYVLALISKDKPLDKLRENCIDRLDVFLAQETTTFVDQLFDAIQNRKYLNDGKKENVQPEVIEETHQSTESNHSAKEEENNNDSDDRHPMIESHPIPTTSQSLKRNSSNRNERFSPRSKRKHRSFSPSSPNSSPPSSSAKHSRHFDDSNDFEKTNIYSSDVSSRDYPYNPETPQLDYDPFQSYSTNPPRTLVTVVTNSEPLTTDSDERRPISQRINRTKRHVVTTSDQRQRKRPYHPGGKSNHNGTTLEVRKIPVEFNTVSKLDEHFRKFGCVTNVQIAFDGSPDSALIAYRTFEEADTAYKNPQPLFNNRFIKIFWHKGQNSAPNPPLNEVRPAKKSIVPPHPTKLHWSKSPKISVRPKKKSVLPVGPSSIKKEAAKKAAIEIRRKKTGLIEEQIQQQKLLLKKLETAETNEEKESIRSLMKQIDATINNLKDSFRIPTPEKKLTQQDLLKKRAEILQKQLETLRAKTSAEMRRAITNTIETKIPNPKETNGNIDAEEEDRLLLNPTD